MIAPVPGTPLPWSVGEAVDHSLPCVDAFSGNEICECWGQDTDTIRDEACEANAAYIVHAANCFPELVEAANKAVKWLAISDDPRCTKDLHDLEAALAKANAA